MPRKFKVSVWVELSVDVSADSLEDAETRALAKIETVAAHSGFGFRSAGQPTTAEAPNDTKK